MTLIAFSIFKKILLKENGKIQFFSPQLGKQTKNLAKPRALVGGRYFRGEVLSHVTSVPARSRVSGLDLVWLESMSKRKNPFGEISSQQRKVHVGPKEAACQEELQHVYGMTTRLFS